MLKHETGWKSTLPHSEFGIPHSEFGIQVADYFGNLLVTLVLRISGSRKTRRMRKA